MLTVFIIQLDNMNIVISENRATAQSIDPFQDWGFASADDRAWSTFKINNVFFLDLNSFFHIVGI